MWLYHGSNRAVSQPKLIAQTRGLDFGSGFYLTTNEEQAERFSEIVVNRRKHACRAPFESADAAWLRFVVDNRLNRYSGEVIL